MDSLEARLLRSLSSETRLRIIGLLKEGVDHPGDLAKDVGVVRQAIDKHLLDMHALGLVERSAHFPPTGRPRVVYSLSPKGAELYNGIEKIINAFANEMKQQYRDSKKDLDTKLIMGQIGEKGYEKKLGELNDRYAMILE